MNADKAILTGGVSYAYLKEIVKNRQDIKLIRVGTPFPMPEDFLLKALDGVKELLCVEELSPYLEESAQKLAGLYHLNLTIRGKRTGDVPHAGENSADSLRNIVAAFAGGECKGGESPDMTDAPALPVRPPVLCAGCPHRASFYAVKVAMKGKKGQLLRRYRLLYAGKCYAAGHGRHLSVYGSWRDDGAGAALGKP